MHNLSRRHGKSKFYTELAYLFGLIAIALGTAFIDQAEFGVAMPLVSAHVVHGLLHHYHWITLGMIEVAFQAVLFVILVVVCREIKRPFFISMATGVLYAGLLDLFIVLLRLLPHTIYVRIIFFILGFFIFAAGEMLLHYTYVQSEFYEFFCHELTERYHLNFYRVKFIFEASLCLLGIVISLIFYGIEAVHGLGIGTLICALFTIKTSRLFGKLWLKSHYFTDRFNIRKYFRE